jgi:hypothetical protein
MRKILACGIVFGLFAATFAGCGDTTKAPTGAASTGSSKSVAGSKFLLTSEPAGAATVIDARKSAKDDENVVVVGRIGGSTNPWVEGRAAFSIVDQTLKACSDIPGDTCETPWDYCCETDKLPSATALVKFVDESGSQINADAREMLNLKELQTVVVRGKAKRDEAGNLTVLATGVFVRK